MTHTPTERLHLKSPQIFKILTHLSTLLTVTDAEKGIVKYAPGHDDHTVAKEFDVQSHQVARLRVDNFGKLFIMGAPDNLAERVETLEKQVADLIRQVGILKLKKHWED